MVDRDRRLGEDQKEQRTSAMEREETPQWRADPDRRLIMTGLKAEGQDACLRAT